MEIIPYEQFARLRLNQLVPPDIKIAEANNWEWMGGIWVNEGIGFTSMSRYEDTPNETGGLEVDFSELPQDAARAIFAAIHLPLRRGRSEEHTSELQSR